MADTGDLSVWRAADSISRTLDDLDSPRTPGRQTPTPVAGLDGHAHRHALPPTPARTTDGDRADTPIDDTTSSMPPATSAPAGSDVAGDNITDDGFVGDDDIADDGFVDDGDDGAFAAQMVDDDVPDDILAAVGETDGPDEPVSQPDPVPAPDPISDLTLAPQPTPTPTPQPDPAPAPDRVPAPDLAPALTPAPQSAPDSAPAPTAVTTETTVEDWIAALVGPDSSPLAGTWPKTGIVWPGHDKRVQITGLPDDLVDALWGVLIDARLPDRWDDHPPPGVDAARARELMGTRLRAVISQASLLVGHLLAHTRLDVAVDPSTAWVRDTIRAADAHWWRVEEALGRLDAQNQRHNALLGRIGQRGREAAATLTLVEHLLVWWFTDQLEDLSSGDHRPETVNLGHERAVAVRDQLRRQTRALAGPTAVPDDHAGLTAVPDDHADLDDPAGRPPGMS